MGTKLRKLADLVANPSRLDSLANYAGAIPGPEWLVVITRNRDSDLLTESNWDAALEELRGELRDIEIFRFGHWACGWWEALAVKAGTPAETIGQDIVNRLNSYPVLDEDDFYERQIEEANRIWTECYTSRERLDYVRKHRSEFDFQNLADLRAVIRGDYFNGDAFALIA